MKTEENKQSEQEQEQEQSWAEYKQTLDDDMGNYLHDLRDGN